MDMPKWRKNKKWITFSHIFAAKWGPKFRNGKKAGVGVSTHVHTYIHTYTFIF